MGTLTKGLPANILELPPAQPAEMALNAARKGSTLDSVATRNPYHLCGTVERVEE
jgi:hypothetical protein